MSEPWITEIKQETANSSTLFCRDAQRTRYLALAQQRLWTGNIRFEPHVPGNTFQLPDVIEEKFSPLTAS